MTKVDQFESIFRSADKVTLHYDPPKIGSVLLVTDLEQYDADRLLGEVRTFLGVLDGDVTWTAVNGASFSGVTDLLTVVEKHRPDLICTYRHLHTDGWRHGFTLGDHTEVLTQATPTPVLVLPHPERRRDESNRPMKDTDSVMAITDHLTGDDRLVSWAAAFTQSGGTLRLTHVEDEAAVDRFLDAVSKIPEIDTDTARRTVHAQVVKEPTDFIESCRSVLETKCPAITIEPIVTLGHRLRDHVDLIKAHQVDLVVFNTKDEDQMAMHGLAYPLAVELRDTPLLML